MHAECCLAATIRIRRRHLLLLLLGVFEGCPMASTRVELWRGRGRHEGAAAKNRKQSPLFTVWQSLRSLCKTGVTRFKRKFVRQWWQQFRLMDTVFVSLFELIEASRRVHTAKEINCHAVWHATVESWQTLLEIEGTWSLTDHIVLETCPQCHWRL